MRKITLLLCLTLFAQHSAYAAAGTVKSKTSKFVPQQAVLIDSVVAVVNDDVITRYELDDRLRVVVRQLQKQGTPLPATDVLEKQLLERMIADMLQ